MRDFPVCTFNFLSRDPALSRRIVSGGTAISGGEDLVHIDYGGYVSIRFGEANLISRSEVLAWRATSTWLEGGATPTTVAFCDPRHQPTNGRIRTRHSDGTPFSDESLYSQGDCVVVVADSAEMGATELTMDVSQLGKPLEAGEWFSIDHTFMRNRAYNIHYIDGDTIRFLPPLREDVAAGESMDFNNPKCTMRLVGDMRSPVQMGSGYQTGDVEFVEHFPDENGYDS